MTTVQLPAQPGRSRSEPLQPVSPASDDAGFRRAMDRQTLDLFAAVVDSAQAVPGSASDPFRALAGADQDAAALAAGELSANATQAGIRDRGLDASSRSSQELAQRSAAAPAQNNTGLSKPQQSEAAVDRPADAPASNASRSTSDAGDSPGRVTERETPPSAESASRPAQPSAEQAPAQSVAQASAAQSARPVSRGATQSGSQPLAGVPASSSGAGGGAANASGGASGNSTSVFAIERSGSARAGMPGAKPADLPKGAADAEPSAQVQRGLAQVLRQRGGTLSLRLTPNELGEVKISLTVRSGRVDGVIEAEHAVARDLLKQHIDGLRSSLEQRGVTVDRLEVRLRDAATMDARSNASAEADGSIDPDRRGAGGDRGGSDQGAGGAGTDGRGGGTGRGQEAEPDNGLSAETIDGVPEHGRPQDAAGRWIRLDTIV